VCQPTGAAVCDSQQVLLCVPTGAAVCARRMDSISGLSSHAPKRNRSVWFLTVSKCEGTSEIVINYKNTKGTISPFSKSKSNAIVKIPWGTPNQCKFLVTQKGNEKIGEFIFTTKRREVEKFKEHSLNSFEGGVNSFSKKITCLIVEKKQHLLAVYLTLLSHTVGFVHHREGLHTEDGFLVEAGDDALKICDLEKNGGSMEDFAEFVRFANENAQVVKATSIEGQDISTFFSKKRKSVESNKTPKKSKAATIDDMEDKELKDKEGLEKEYSQSFVGLANIPLENISVSGELDVKVNKFRVYSVVQSMRKRYDPSMSVPVVCPADVNTAVDLRNVKNQKFFVVQKIHAVEAWKELQKSGEFKQLPSHQNGTVLCFVLRTSSSGIIHYGNVRSNDIQNQFSKDTTAPQDMLRIYQSLCEKDSPSIALKCVERMARLSRIGPNEITAIRKLCNWSPESFAALMKVITQYELYQTMDVKPKGHQNRLAQGLKMNLTNVMFKMLGKVEEEFFMNWCVQILNSESSLKCCVDEFENLNKVEKVSSILSVIAEYKPYEDIKREHPGKFLPDKLKEYVGAEIKNGEKNEEAKQLEKYYKRVIGEESGVGNTNVEVYTDLGILFRENDWFEKFEVVIFHMSEENRDICFDFVNNSLLSGCQARVITFPSEAQQFEVLQYLRNQQLSKDPLLKVIPLIFQSNAFLTGDICENIQFSVIFGNFVVLSPPLSMYYSNISGILNIVEKICPPKSNVAFISDLKSPLVQVHSETVSSDVSYFGLSAEVDKFRQQFYSIQLQNSTEQLDENKNPPQPEAARHRSTTSDTVDQSSTSPFKSNNNLVSDQRGASSENLKSGFLERLDSIAKDVYKFDGDDEPEVEQSDGGEQSEDTQSDEEDQSGDVNKSGGVVQFDEDLYK
jgi:hypothetical protein